MGYAAAQHMPGEEVSSAYPQQYHQLYPGQQLPHGQPGVASGSGSGPSPQGDISYGSYGSPMGNAPGVGIASGLASAGSSAAYQGHGVGYDSLPASMQSVSSQIHLQAPGTAPPVPASAPDPLLAIPPEPQALVVEDTVVLIRNPREFFRKKNLMTIAGPGAFQVFTDFERVVTGCRASDGTRLLGTAELLETSPALLPQAVSALRNVAVEFDSVDMDDSGFEEYTRRCQEIIATQAGMHMAAVSPVSRDFVSSGKLVLREGAVGALNALARIGVPTFVFSSGYGDLVAQVLVQAGVTDSAQPSAIPQNVRVIR